MRIFVDTASLAEIEEWDAHPWVAGFTTNPTLMRAAGATDATVWAKELVALTDKPVSIDGPPTMEYGPRVWWKVTRAGHPNARPWKENVTAICSCRQVPREVKRDDILSVFAGRIMDTGRDPQPVIDAAKATGAQVLWASVREPYNIVQAEHAGCDIVTVPPPILRKWLDWHGKPLEVVAQETIAQFDADRDGLW